MRRLKHNFFGSFRLALAGLMAAGLLGGASAGPTRAQGSFALRFYGHGAGDIDRVKIPIEPAVPADIGGDFTLEAWLKAEPGANASTAGQCGSNDGWIFGNIVFDRDQWGNGDYGDFGVSLSGGRVVFGVSRGASGTTVCSTSSLADGAWHHLALTRRAADGQLSVFVDGRLEAQASGPIGDVSYRNNRAAAYPADPFLVIGAEKHDAGAAYPSFNGWVDEVRLSTSVRYTADFARPGGPFTPDAGTAALYHFDEGPAGACSGQVLDSSGAPGGPSHGVCRYGGTGLAGPVYVTDTPFAGGPAPTASLTAPAAPTATRTPTRTPTNPPAVTATPSRTPAPVVSPLPTAVPDLIFADQFEAGGVLAWTSSVTDSGDLAVAGPAALVGDLGLQAVLDNNVSVYVLDDTPNAETRWRARFYFDPNGIGMANGDAHYLLYGYSGGSALSLRLEFGRSSGQYRLRAAASSDAGAWGSTAWTVITDAPHFVELDWRAASAAGANDGGLTFWIDGVQRAALAGLDNDQRRLERYRLGAVAGVDTGTRGTYYLDAVEARRFTYIGPAGDGPAPAATPTAPPATAVVNTATATRTPIPPTATIAATPLSTANWALSFDGQGDVVRAQAVPGVGPLTVEAWVRPAANNATGLLVVGADADRGWSLELDGGNLIFYIATAGGWQSGRHTARLAAGQWYHVAATYTGGDVRIFVDGLGVRAAGLGTLTQGPAMSLGGLEGYPFFAGALDEVRVSRSVRYPADFARPGAPFTPDVDTLALWHFDEGAGQTARDASAAGNHATLGVTAGADTADPAWVAGVW
jgi:hypothetical protein